MAPQNGQRDGAAALAVNPNGDEVTVTGFSGEAYGNEAYESDKRSH